MDDGGFGQGGIHFLDGDVEAGGDVVDRLVALGDDAHVLGDGLGGDGMITGDHDHLADSDDD